MKSILYKQVDNTAISLFRIFFGLFLMLEGFGAILTGWVKRVFIDPEFTFSFILFPFLQALPGKGMYLYYIVLGILGLGIMLGYKYKIAIITYAVLWSGVYFMQKTSYNNHYYLMMLLCWIMVFVPANKRFSLDSKLNPEIKSNKASQWIPLLFITQIAIVYSFAAIAKLYPDWLNLKVPNSILTELRSWPYMGGIFKSKFHAYAVAYVGIFYDLLVVPALLWKPTRRFTFIFSVFFHLFNSIVVQVGVFPYLALSFSLFFFPAERLHQVFRIKNQDTNIEYEIITPKFYKLKLYIISFYVVLQICLPLRHWFIKDNVLWTEEGHRLSWRMMLRSRSGILTIYLVNNETGERTKYQYRERMTYKQARALAAHPDIMWQFSQKLSKELGQHYSIYLESKVSINGSEYYPFIDPQQDMTKAKWNHFGHNDWILESPPLFH